MGTNRHLAFTVDTRAEVDTFYPAALEADADVIEAPAVHPKYHADYYGAFIRDPHGINLDGSDPQRSMLLMSG